ncbi:hypothetical protein EIN_138230 [Entamoeba invadens IP1]|uniref:Uncharacterized protein n=1 Tax=Entamoeba invadens IP1 TaxID=370355 RepID=L7FMU2_ENTIV|nr:hypothetical protein EIN_138230 [Entamoeba invadens IP1]ELP91806.1 hypothetical protein EIN_138230 [Entamoeba invadens IP1]|eukprot:XP_004258577.1 hypothetical protein EIN_138230 [Entamoeba invadens IP1]
MVPPYIKARDLHGVFYENGGKVNQLYAITEGNVSVRQFCDADLRALTCLTKFTLNGGSVSVKFPTSLVELQLSGSSKADNLSELKQLTLLNGIPCGNHSRNNNVANSPCQIIDDSDDEVKEEKNEEEK